VVSPERLDLLTEDSRAWSPISKRKTAHIPLLKPSSMTARSRRNSLMFLLASFDLYFSCCRSPLTLLSFFFSKSELRLRIHLQESRGFFLSLVRGGTPFPPSFLVEGTEKDSSQLSITLERGRDRTPSLDSRTYSLFSSSSFSSSFFLPHGTVCRPFLLPSRFESITGGHFGRLLCSPL